MKKQLYTFAFLISLMLAACGSNGSTTFSSNGLKITSSQNTAPKVTMQAVLAEAEKGIYKKGEILVKFKAGVSAKSAAGVHRAMGATVEKKFSAVSNLERVKLPAGVTVKDAIVSYMQDPNVEYAEPNYVRFPKNTVPNDPYFNPQQWALQNMGTFGGGTAGADIKMPQAWDITQGSPNVVVAVIDSGVGVNHPDLINNIWRNPSETNCADGIDNDGNGFIDDCGGWNFADKNNTPFDNLGHGTHVAGIIGAVGNNGIGVAGVMWNVQIMPLKFITDFGPDVCGQNVDFCGSVDDEVSAIQYAIRNGAKIINASYGSGTFSQAEFDAINAANNAGVLFIAAAGNASIGQRGDDNDVSPVYPASHRLPNIISVAATDQNDVKATFSNFGFNSVHVAAPGVYILSTIPSSGISMSFISFCTGSFASDYDFCSGTSMATPHVTGLAGILESSYPSFTAEQIRATILRYVDVLTSLQGVVQTGGRINAFKALSALLSPTGLIANAQSSTQITLSWTDNATGEDGYKIERKVAGGAFTEVAQIGPNSTSFTDSGLAASTTYTYRVRAFNVIPADSTYSNEASTTTLASDSSGGSSGGDGGGGGCSVGRKQSGPTQVADALVILTPLFVIIALKNSRRKKK